MTNFATATNATATALNSSGSAAEENARYLESIEARATAVSAAFQQMSLKVVDSDLVKGILDIAKAFAEFGTTDFGAGITQFILLSGVSWGGLQLLGNSILPGIIKSFSQFGELIGTVASGAGTLTEALGAYGLGASLPIIMGVVGGLLLLVTVIKAIKSAYDEANPSVAEATANMQQAQQALQSTEKAYQNAKVKLEELNSIPFEDRTTEIQMEIDELQSLIEYYEALAQIRQGTYGKSREQYIKAVEKEGFETEGYDVTFGPVDRKITQSYNSLSEAVTETALQYYNLTGKVIEFETIAEGQQKLEKIGVTFEKSTISTSNLAKEMHSLSLEMLQNKEVTPRMASEYEKLMQMATPYADKLKEKRLEGVHALKQEEIEFLNWYGQLETAYIRLNEFAEFNENSTNSMNSQASATEQAASALSTFAQNLLAASAAYQLFKDQMEATGDYDDSFKGLTSVFGELNGEIEKGQVGSKAFFTALELLTGQTFEDSSSATEYLNNNLETLTTLFGDSESGGTGLITAMQNLQTEGKLTGASIKEVDGNLEISVDSFSDLANSLGISESSLYSLTQALKVMGINFEYEANDMLDKVSELGEGIVDNLGDKTTVNFEKFVEKAKEAGMSTDEISQIGEVLSNASNVDLTNVNEGLELLNGSSEDASGSADDLTGSLEDIGSTSGGISETASAMEDLSSNISSAAGSATSLYSNLSKVSGLKFPSLFGRHFAEGTNNAPEGDSLVNEEGPELIQSRDKAYIAGGGAPAVTHLNKGDIVYNADETKDILNNRNLNWVIQSNRLGNTISKSTIGVSGIKPLSISSNVINRLKTSNNKKTSSGNNVNKDASPTTSTTSQSQSDKSIKDEFDEWLKAKKHALAMDEITEEQYYTELEKMNEKYFKNSKEYQDEYWKYQEEVYKWRKSQLDDENKLLEKQIDLEKALSELAKAKEQKILVYKDGRFQYVQDIDAIDKAQRNVSKLKADLGYASGTSNASSGIHLVGENGPELRVLNSGDGIIPADATKNLLSLAQMSVSKLSGDLNKAMQILYSFNISDISLPNVKNASEFFEGLKNYAYQYSYS